ncbi:hypothetical protein FGB62_12g328 [Gracilaria domingensis]|nr:hypothetical protein FGB62_12g328 [Gracilaria domingensis]
MYTLLVLADGRVYDFGALLRRRLVQSYGQRASREFGKIRRADSTEGAVTEWSVSLLDMMRGTRRMEAPWMALVRWFGLGVYKELLQRVLFVHDVHEFVSEAREGTSEFKYVVTRKAVVRNLQCEVIRALHEIEQLRWQEGRLPAWEEFRGDCALD